MNKFSNKEAIATYLGWSFDEVEDYRYHYGMTKAPVYTAGNRYIIALPNGKKPTKHDVEYIGEFKEMADSMGEYCKSRGRTVWVFESK